MRNQTITGLLLAVLAQLPPVHAAEGEVGALCHLEPNGAILDLAGTRGGSVGELLVQPGQQVEAGTELARFSSHAALQAQQTLAELDVQELEQTRKLRLSLQALALKGARVAHQRAVRSLANYRKLGSGSRSERELLQRKAKAEDTRLAVSREELHQEQLQRELEIKLQQARARLALAEAGLRDASLRAPVAGTILEIHRQPGESLDGRPVVRMADLQRIYAVCDVYEGDLLKITPGQKADISGNALPESVPGSVERIGRIVDTGSRLARVWIRLEQTDPASRLLGMEVNAIIHR